MANKYKTLIVNNGSKYTERIIEICQNDGQEVYQIGWSEFKFQNLDYDLYILTGGHQIPVENHEKDFSEEINMIRNIDKPIIGICLGFELIANAFGSDLVKMPTKERDELPLTVINNDMIFDGIQSLKVYESHKWKVSKLGDDLIPLAKSKSSIEVIKHRQKQIYGFQFHPEESREGDCGIKLFDNIFSLIRVSRQLDKEVNPSYNML